MYKKYACFIAHPTRVDTIRAEMSSAIIAIVGIAFWGREGKQWFDIEIMPLNNGQIVMQTHDRYPARMWTSFSFATPIVLATTKNDDGDTQDFLLLPIHTIHFKVGPPWSYVNVEHS